ncbi:MAG TPA: iron transporter [Azospirillum sp.]|nr:iron transporter [Azospirillum sp.]
MLFARPLAASLLALGLATAPAMAGESPIGQPIEKNGLNVIGVYLQPVVMEPAMDGQDAKKTDIHLEADIKALADNPNGFREDSWVPYLTVEYTLAKRGSDWKAKGVLHPMVANDGPHYGANVALNGPGQYDVTFVIAPPDGHGFMRHTDKETGVAGWWKPFEFKGDFKFVGTGKKGGY